MVLFSAAFRNLRFFLAFTIVLLALHSGAQPVVNTFSPASAPAGATVTISGSNFSSTPANNIVYFGKVRATVTSASGTSLQVTVPAGSGYQPVTITVGALTGASRLPFVVSFAGAAPQFTNRSFEFGGRADSIEGNIETTKYALGDLDNDGRIDIAVVDRLNNALILYRNISTTGAVAFAPAITYTTGLSPRAVAIDDLDGDGKLDIAVTNISANTVSVFRNTSTSGSISLAAKTDFATNTQPSGLAITDIDGDGRPELVINCIGLTGYISVLRNTTSGAAISFATKFDLAIPGGSMEEVYTGDIDGDGKTDIVLPVYAAGVFSVFRNTSTSGAIAFDTRRDFAAANGFPEQLQLADLNADGKLDICLTYYVTSKIVEVYQNVSTPGTVEFYTSQSMESFSTTDGLVAEDFDGDGKPDLAVNTAFDSVSLFKNTSAAGGPISFAPFVKVENGFTAPLLAADFDLDGKVDLASRAGLYRVVVRLNKTTEPQITAITPQEGSSGTAITIKGFNFSGVTSVTIGGQSVTSFTVVNSTTIVAYGKNGASGAVGVSAPYGLDSFGYYQYYPRPTISSFSPDTAGAGQSVVITGTNFLKITNVYFGNVPAASFTLNSPTSITAIVGAGASGAVKVTIPGNNDSAFGFVFLPAPVINSFSPASGTSGTTLTITGTNFSNVSSVNIGGAPAASFVINSPTSITAVIGSGNTGNVEVTTRGGTATLPGFTYQFPAIPVINALSSRFDTIGSTITITGSNFNTNAADNLVYFGQARAVVTAASGTQLTVKVPDGVTYQPIRVTNAATHLSGFSEQPFIVKIPQGAVNFKLHQDFPVGNTVPIVHHIAMGDLNSDGKQDLVSANNNEATISILLNSSTTGNLNFSKTEYSCPAGADLVAIGDMDGDGRQDIIVAGGDGTTIFRNTSSGGVTTFAAGTVLPTNIASGLVLNDFDQDGLPDLVVSEIVINRVALFRNSSVAGRISFYPVQYFQLGADPTGLADADLDGDGKADLVSCNANNTISVLRSSSTKGVISFAAYVSFAAGESPVAICAGDLDGDGKNDLAVASKGENAISVLRNQSTAGSLAFGTQQKYADRVVNVGSDQRDIAMADFTGDGKPEICISQFISPGLAQVFNNNSSPGTIQMEALVYSAFFTGSNATGIAIGDLDLDGRPDLALGNFWGSKLSVLQHDYLPKMKLTGFAPPYGRKGTNVVISGENIYGVTGVLFGGVPAASFSVFPPNQIYAEVASGDSGYITVLNQGGNDSLPGFIFIPPPVITKFTPVTGVPGDTITIIGHNFVDVDWVDFGGTVTFGYRIVSPDTIRVAVPAGAGSGSIKVVTESGTASLSGFNPVLPVITGFTPSTAAKGETVTITGSHFDGATAVAFGGVPAASFTVVSGTTITAVVGTGANGAVSVKNADGIDSLSGFTFKVVTAVTDLDNDPDALLQLAPNPASTVIKVTHPAVSKPTTILIMDGFGRRVRSVSVPKLSKESTVQLNGLANGWYHLLWINGSDQYHRTLMINR